MKLLIVGILMPILAYADIGKLECENKINNNFKIMDTTRFINKPDLSEYNINGVRMIYEGSFFKNYSDYEIPSDKKIKDVAEWAFNRTPDMPIIILDIEKWKMYNQPMDVISDSAYRLTETLRIFKNHYPNKDAIIGYYMMSPIRDYWRAIKGESDIGYQKWQEENNAAQSVADMSDALFPSLYTFYDKLEKWEIYAKANVKEARRMAKGKPVYCTLWPRFHNSNKLIGGDYIPEYFFKRQLDVVYDQCDGLVIWDGKKIEWDPNAGWWKALQQFSSEITVN